jgi:hypothetical protein
MESLRAAVAVPAIPALLGKPDKARSLSGYLKTTDNSALLKIYLSPEEKS